MSRKNIFDLVKSNYNIIDEIRKIHKIVYHESEFFGIFKIDESTGEEYCARAFSFIQFSREYLYRSLPDVGTCLALDEFIVKADAFLDFYHENDITEDKIINFLEIIENLLFLYFKKEKSLRRRGGIDFYSTPYEELIFLMDTLEKHLGLTIKKTIDRVLLHKKDYKLAKIIDNSTNYDLASELISYSREKNDYISKRKILKHLDIYLEPLIDKAKKNKSIQPVIYKMADDLGFLFNNFSIRHNNSDKDSNDYKQMLENYTEKDYENVYDLTYELILDFLVSNDYINLQGEINKLKSNWQ